MNFRTRFLEKDFGFFIAGNPSVQSSSNITGTTAPFFTLAEMYRIRVIGADQTQTGPDAQETKIYPPPCVK